MNVHLEHAIIWTAMVFLGVSILASYIRLRESKLQSPPRAVPQAFYYPHTFGKWHVHYDDGGFSAAMSKAIACDYARIFGGSAHDMNRCGHGV